jgi:DNA-binding NtrC family response regulator
MRSFLLVSKEKEILNLLRRTLDPRAKVEHTKSKDAGYKAALQQFRQAYPAVEVIVISPQEMIREAVKAVKAGAADYLTCPIEPEEVKYVIESINEAILLRSELDYLKDQFWQPSSLAIIQTKSPVMQEVFAKIRSVAPTKSAVLLKRCQVCQCPLRCDSGHSFGKRAVRT